MKIEATLDVQIEQVEGPKITDAAHVVAWTCADGAWLDGGRNSFRFEVCTIHTDPDACDGPLCDAGVSIFRASVTSADYEIDATEGVQL